ncbi:MAG: hypothetical protein H0W44_10620 [Gammaproteobacteria bacterium]|nr:hypothetical protein [Gammaproteobacteria bacterium]
MSKLEVKLREVEHKRARQKLLNSVDPALSNLLSKAEFSHDRQSLKYAAFSAWDIKANEQTTTRGKVKDWELKYFNTPTEIVSFIKTNVKPANAIGWFFVDSEGPYYSLSLSEFLLNLSFLQDYCEKQNHFDIGWVGKSADMGIVFEFNHNPFGHNEFEVCMWGGINGNQ